MKFFAAAVLALSLVVAVAANAAAQAPPDPGSSSAAPRPDAGGPGVERPQGADDPAALPRAPAQRTTIFGLSPTGAVLMAASLLIIVVLAVVAMTRSHDAYDFDRRE